MMINKNDLLERLKYVSKWNTPVSRWILDVIRNTPDAVVRCWSCKHCEKSNMYPDLYYCTKLNLHVKEDQYCAWGKKARAK